MREYVILSTPNALKVVGHQVRAEWEDESLREFRIGFSKD